MQYGASLTGVHRESTEQFIAACLHPGIDEHLDERCEDRIVHLLARDVDAHLSDLERVPPGPIRIGGEQLGQGTWRGQCAQTAPYLGAFEGKGFHGLNLVAAGSATPAVRSLAVMDEQTLKGIRAGLLAFLIWGFLVIYWKALSNFDAIELIGWRIIMMTIVMAIVISIRRGWSPVLAALRTPRIVGQSAIAGILLAINWSTFLYAVATDHVVETALGYFLAPLGTMAIGVLLLRENLTPLRWTAISFAVVAVVILTVSYGHIPWMALVIAISFSLYGLAKRNIPLAPTESLTAEGLVLVLPAIILVAIWSTRPLSVIPTATPLEWVLVLGTGLATAIPLLLFARAAQTVPFVILGPLNYLVPIINFTLGWLVYDESMPASRLAGFVLVWCALIAVTVDTVQSSRRSIAAVPTRLPVR